MNTRLLVTAMLTAIAPLGTAGAGNTHDRLVFAAAIPADLKARLVPLIGRFQAPVGSIGSLPGL
jgi:hypothetical protein